MAKAFIDDTNLTNIANAIRTKLGVVDTYLPSEMAGAIGQIGGDLVYGVQWDTENSSPTLTRIGNMMMHRILPIQSMMRRCLVTDAGVVTYLSENDSTKLADGTTADLTGASGQVMVEIPRHWRKFVTNGTTRQVLLSIVPLQGYHEVPTMYVSAYEAALDRTNLKLSSVVNTDTQYRGGNNTSSWDGTYRSLLGMPATNIDTTTFRTYARARGTGWEMYAYEVQKTLYWLFCVEYATFNSQLAFNPYLNVNGFHQGGLGNGVTTWNSTWNSYNSYNPLVPCGTTNPLGNHTGVVAYTPEAGGGYTPPTFDVPSYRGVENPFGHVWKLSDGAMMVYESSSPNFYVCPLSKHNSWASTKNSDYELKGVLATSSRVYAKRHLFGNDGECVPDLAGGSGASSTTYLCDYFYIQLSSTCVLAFGGCTNDDAYAGLGYAYANRDFSFAYAHFGSRLCYFPF